MLAVVAGTFVFVGATEVIPEKSEDSEHKWKKLFALMSGIVSHNTQWHWDIDPSSISDTMDRSPLATQRICRVNFPLLKRRHYKVCS
jgi:hypothetical protein